MTTIGVHMTFDEAVAHFGSSWRMCIKLGIRGQNGAHWKRNNRIPVLQQMRIEAMTDGALKADLSHFHRANRID